MSFLLRVPSTSCSALLKTARRPLSLTASLSAKKAKTGRLSVAAASDLYDEPESTLSEESRPPAEHDADPNSFANLGRDIIFLRGAKTFFRQTRSSMLRDMLEKIQSPEEMRECFEYLKIWRLNGGLVDWDLGRLVVEKSLVSTSPHLALYALMNPTTFGLHLSSPFRPPFPVPTYTTSPPTPEETNRTIKHIHDEVAARGDSLLFERREPHFTTLPSPTAMSASPADLQPVDSVRPPTFFREFVRVLFVGSEEEGRSRELTAEEVGWLAEQAARHLPYDPLVTSVLLNYYSHLPDNSGLAKFGKLQSSLRELIALDIGTVELSEQERRVVGEQLEQCAFPLKWAGELFLPLVGRA